MSTSAGVNAGTLCFPTKRRTATPSNHQLTVVVPAYNEQSRLPGTLEGLKTYLDHWQIDYRVVVADDGSCDATATLAAAYGPRFSTISLPRQQGKGAAVRAGMLSATGDVVAFTDADLPYDLSALRAGYELVAGHQAEVAFGARDLEGSTCLTSRRWTRTAATLVFREIVRRLVSQQVTDTQCGLKIFSRSAALEIFSRTTIDGFAFDAEVVFLTHRLRLPFVRIPVTLINEYSSTISLTRHALPMLMDVVGLRWRSLRGMYGLNLPRIVIEIANDVVAQARTAA